jgi:hypothetical protein
MKAKKSDWIIKVSYISEDLQYVVRHINIPNATKREVICSTQSFPENSVIRIYELEDIL